MYRRVDKFIDGFERELEWLVSSADVDQMVFSTSLDESIRGDQLTNLTV